MLDTDMEVCGGEFFLFENEEITQMKDFEAIWKN